MVLQTLQDMGADGVDAVTRTKSMKLDRAFAEAAWQKQESGAEEVDVDAADVILEEKAKNWEQPESEGSTENDSEQPDPEDSPIKTGKADSSDGDGESKLPEKKWKIKVGKRAVGIRNRIREIMDTISGKENPSKKVLSLAQGDPTAYPHLRPADFQVSAIVNTLKSGTDSGYQPSQGNRACRSAIAKAFSVPGRSPLTAGDIFMTVGCSEGLSHCIAAFAAEGANMLLPRPGFPLYQVLCDFHGVEVRYYNLLPDSDWEIDIESLDGLTDEKTCALLVNNPSNPCGAVYSKSHLTKVLAKAEELRLPVLADEVYKGMTFGDEFVPCSAVTTTVPVLSVCALSKRWLAPGWRVGWVAVQDANGILEEADVLGTLLKLCQVSLGPSSPIQAAIPEILEQTPPEWYAQIMTHLKTSAECCVRRVKETPGLQVASEPHGAMYFMVKLEAGKLQGIDTDDVKFAGALLEEESVVVLPGQCFEAPGFFRVVFAAPSETLNEAWDRIEAFCRRRLQS